MPRDVRAERERPAEKPYLVARDGIGDVPGSRVFARVATAEEVANRPCIVLPGEEPARVAALEQPLLPRGAAQVRSER